MSAKPLTEHLCAMCGCLLGPAMGSRTQLQDTGRPGCASQVRGKRCSAYDLPPFLLLFSKALLARVPLLSPSGARWGSWPSTRCERSSSPGV